jgi:hypothetical protein
LLFAALIKGSIDVRVHDEAYVRIHLGYIDKNMDFFLARICFKGGAKYVLNILKVRSAIKIFVTNDLLLRNISAICVKVFRS